MKQNGGGSTQAVSLTAFFPFFFYDSPKSMDGMDEILCKHLFLEKCSVVLINELRSILFQLALYL